MTSIPDSPAAATRPGAAHPGQSAPELGEEAEPNGVPRRPALLLRGAALFAISLFAVVLCVVVFSSPDPTIQGDEASYVYSALSLRGGDLTYDAEDQSRWEATGWTVSPLGLYLQAHGDGWAMAKPIGYSAYLAGFLAAFGLRGIQIAGALALMGYAACWYFSGRLRWGWEVSAIVAATASLASYIWWYAFPATVDLFFATLVGVVTYGGLRAALRRDARWFWAAAAVAGLLLTEKVPALLALVPFLVAVALRLTRRQALVGLAVLVTVAALSTIPYWHYSDGASWSAYGGERYYAQSSTPWSGGTVDDLERVDSDEVITPTFVLDRITSPSSDLPSATLTYVAGRHTGVLTFLPIVPMLVIATVVSLVVAARRRGRSGSDAGSVPLDRTEQADDDGDRRAGRVAEGPESDRAMPDRTVEATPPDPSGYELALQPSVAAPVDRLVASAALLTLIAYASFYLVLFTTNYYGGGHSIGSRYFLQFSAVAVAVPVAGGLRARWAIVCSGLAATWALVVLGPLMPKGPIMYNEFWHTTSAQRLLPFDATQDRIIGVWTGPEDDAANSGPFVWAASDLYSTTGEVVGSWRRVEEGRDAAGYLVYGPYGRLIDGTYAVEVIYESPEPSDRTVLRLDAALVGDPVAQMELHGTSGEKVRVAMEFEATRAAGWEYRLYWDGSGDATVHSVRVERISD